MVTVYLILILLLLPSCELQGPHNKSSIPPDELRSSPERIVIDNREYVLESYMWRDFQPVSPPDGKPLLALIWVTAIDSLAIPPELDATQLWVIKEEHIWETSFSEEEREYVPKHKLEKIARNGPKWGPDIQVDVVVRVTHTRDNGVYLLRVAGQYIGMTM